MRNADLDDLMALNDQLLAMSQAGVPIDAAEETFPHDLSITLDKINSSVARRVSRGDSLEQALETDATVPVWYRNLILSGLRSHDMEGALQDFSRVANSADESAFVAESAMFYPLVVVGLAYLGMIACCLFFVPTLESAYASFRIPPGTGLTVLKTLRDTLPIWVAIPPILFVFFVSWRYRTRSQRAHSDNSEGGLFAAFSGTSRAMFEQRCAYFAESLASLLENNEPFEKALGLAAGACGEPTLAEGARSLAATVAAGQPANADSVAATRFPPFLRWALFQSEPSVGRNRALQMAAALYREASIHAVQRAKIIAPMIWLIILGGSATLLYGLALFVPVIQMLKAVATVH